MKADESSIADQNPYPPNCKYEKLLLFGSSLSSLRSSTVRYPLFRAVPYTAGRRTGRKS